MMKRFFLPPWTALLVIFVIGACASGPEPLPPFPPEATTPSSEGDVFQPGDVITIKFPYHPELDVEQPVRRDGKIVLQLVGEVMAQGKTLGQLREELIGLYESRLKKFEITVLVRTFRTPRVYVGGEVGNPGVVYLEDRMNVLGAVLNSGGFLKASAVVSNVIIIRHRGGKRYATSLDLTGSFTNPESEAFYLEPYDVVYVPRTAIDRVNQWVDQYINKIIPENILLTFNLNWEMIPIRTESQ